MKIFFFCPKDTKASAKGRNLPDELIECPRIGPYHLIVSRPGQSQELLYKHIRQLID